MKTVSATESFVTCRNSQDSPVRGTLMNITGQSAVFEVYNPFSLLQLSEVLSDFKIVVEERTLYSGRAVIRNLVNTGIMVVAEATLVDQWSDTESAASLVDGTLLVEEMARFVRDLSTVHVVRSDMKVLISDFRTFLQELRDWLKKVDVAISTQHATVEEQDRCACELVDMVSPTVAPLMMSYLEQFETAASVIHPDATSIYKTYIRRELHPLILCSPFVHRCFTKPLGYAGDYEMINQLLAKAKLGNLLFAKLINVLTLSVAPAVAHRNRINILHRVMTEEMARCTAEGKKLTAINVACGPAQEVRNFMDTCTESDQCEITLLDLSPEALEFCRQEIDEKRKTTGSLIKVNFLEKSIDMLLRESLMPRSDAGKMGGQYELVYCAGLFDYLTDSVCERLISLFHDWVCPGGMLIVTNIHPSNPARNFMDYILEWNVIHRTEKQLKDLCHKNGPMDVFSDETGVNIFLTMRKDA